MSETRDTYAYFFVRDFDCDFSHITTLIGMAPTEAYNRGELLPCGRARKINTWKIHSPLPKETEIISEHIETLLPVIEAKSKSICKLAGEFHIGLQCVGRYTNAHPGFHISTDTIQRVARLGLSIDFDLYCFCDECVE